MDRTFRERLVSGETDKDEVVSGGDDILIRSSTSRARDGEGNAICARVWFTKRSERRPVQHRQH